MSRRGQGQAAGESQPRRQRGPWAPSVLSSITVESGVRLKQSRCAPSSTARNAFKPASDDDPHGPDDTPSVPSLSDISAADLSLMLIEASTPLRRYGHAIWDGVPQLSPAILVFPVDTVVS